MNGYVIRDTRGEIRSAIRLDLIQIFAKSFHLKNAGERPFTPAWVASRPWYISWLPLAGHFQIPIDINLD